MVKKTRMGKINVPLDIRDENDVPAFEKMLENGPMMVVLVYADWCGHCTKYKDNVWSPLKSVKNRTMNMASVHYDQLDNTSLKNSMIEGYPSLLVVGKDKTPATFKSSNGATTNSLPKANDFTTMKNLVTSPVIEKDDEDVTLNRTNTLPKISSSLKPSTLDTEDTEDTELTLNDTAPVSETAPISETAPVSETVGETVPQISEDVVTLTNSMKTNRTVSSPPPAVGSPTAPRTPVTMMGGRLYRMLSLKKKHRGSSKKRKSTRKTANF